MGLLQEKFQVVEPEPTKASNEWVSDKSVRRTAAEYQNLDRLPPGTNIADQIQADTRTPVRTMSGETDVTKDWSREAVRDGYTRRDVLPTDDAYTAEHVDTFYGEAKVDGDVGFAERGNLLDRI